MAVRYNKLFNMLKHKKITTSELMSRAGFSANIITRLKRNQYISMDSIEKICVALHCGVDDILDFVEVKEN